MDNRRNFIKKVSAFGLLGSIPQRMSGAQPPDEPELTWHASGNGGIVAVGPEVSALAGIDILKKGGNAIDSAVAVIFNLAVSDYGLFSIGGESPFMFFDAKEKKVSVFNGMGGAPKDPMAIEWYYKNGIPNLNGADKGGIRSSTVPSTVSTCLAALELRGTMSFEQVVGSALALLDAGGKSWYGNLAITLRKMVDAEKNANGGRAKKIRAARDRFYKGDIADELNDYYIRSGAFLRKADLASHETRMEEPASISYRGYTVNKCNTWTQGPALLQALRLLEKFDLKSMGHFSPDYIHVTIEAMKLAFADRDRYYGDPDFVKVPLKKLLSDEYTEIRWPLINMKQASKVIRPGDPYKMRADAGPGEHWPGEHGTTTCAVVDKWGNAVAATPSANPQYGICESLGIAHNTRLSSLNIQKGHPNSLEAGKRPRITLTPTIVVKEGKPVIVMSVSGGEMQDQISLQLLLDIIEFGMKPKEAISGPRFKTYHLEDSFNPSADSKARFKNYAKVNVNEIDHLDMNPTDQATVDNLLGRGHKITVAKTSIALPVMIYRDNESGISYAAGQPNARFCAALNTP
jgi:gamma-glutamyltranspeptidase / glutathione hydrolase